MTEIISMFEDTRKIKTVFDQDDHWIIGGAGGFTKFVVYPEPGQGAFVPWVAMYVGDVIVQRMDMTGKGIIYEVDK